MKSNQEIKFKISKHEKPTIPLEKKISHMREQKNHENRIN